jgi:DNA transformation protein
MKKSPLSDAYVAHVIECMRGLGTVEAKRMFGGWGLYHRGTCFAIVMGETLFLKTDEVNSADFDARKLEAFTFVKGGRTMVTSYRMAPGEALEEASAMASWARGAYAAALRKPRRK